MLLFTLILFVRTPVKSIFLRSLSDKSIFFNKTEGPIIIPLCIVLFCDKGKKEYPEENIGGDLVVSYFKLRVSNIYILTFINTISEISMFSNTLNDKSLLVKSTPSPTITFLIIL